MPDWHLLWQGGAIASISHLNSAQTDSVDLMDFSKAER